MQYSNLVVTGSLAKDTIFLYEGLFSDTLLPGHLEHLSVSFNVKKIIKNIGGTLLNIGYAANFFQKQNVKLLGAVGDDIDGKEILEFFDGNKMETKDIIIDKTRLTACGTCISATNSSQIWTFYYGACEAISNLNLAKFTDNNSLLLISPNYKDSFIYLTEQSQNLGIDYVYDVGMLIPVLSKNELESGVNNCKYLIVNEYEIEQIKIKIDFEEKTFVALGKVLITTLGSKGVRYLGQYQEIFVPAYDSNCVDPVGAGDAWRGAFFAELLNGKDLVDCLVMGNAVASISVESKGGVNYKTDKIELQRRFDIIQKNLYVYNCV
jgi:adenosine kinase